MSLAIATAGVARLRCKEPIQFFFILLFLVVPTFFVAPLLKYREVEVLVGLSSTMIVLDLLFLLRKWPFAKKDKTDAR